jgi:hypothetical protein
MDIVDRLLAILVGPNPRYAPKQSGGGWPFGRRSPPVRSQPGRFGVAGGPGEIPRSPAYGGCRAGAGRARSRKLIGWWEPGRPKPVDPRILQGTE